MPRFLAVPDGPFPGFGQGGNLSALPIRLVRGIEIVAATLLVVATAIAFYIHRDVVFVHVGREAEWPFLRNHRGFNVFSTDSCGPG